MTRRKPRHAKFRQPPSRPGRERRSLASRAAAPAVLLAALVALAAPWLAADGAKHKKAPAQDDAALAGLPATSLTSDQAIAHALNTLGYGPRPGDIQRVKRIGLGKWIDQQLHPESLDDSALAARLALFTTLNMSSAQLEENFPRPAVAARRAGMTLEEYRKQQQAQLRAVVNTYGAGDDSQMPDAQAPGGAASVPAPEKIRNPQRIVAELAMAKTDRAIYSEGQLYEHMVDFWFNHFNVFAGKGADRWLLTSYERDAIRPYAMGKFRDLLEATAKSPAMLFYLDNWQSVDPDAWKQRETRVASSPLSALRAAAAGAQAAKKQDRGLNENYGRELMELHTLGVDTGYSQQDVINVARAFTGWTIRMPQRDPQFFFNARLHDSKPKIVLGHTIDAGGIKDGEEVLDLLARDPRTAHHLSLEIAREFVSDDPPPALVERMSQTYLSTDGDIRAVLHTMIYSPEFWAPAAYRAKVKTPFELVVSAARAMNADVQLPLAMVQWVGRIGEPLYQCQTPNGYSDQAQAWVNTGALLNRLNYSLTLAADRLRGASVDAAALLAAEPGAARESAALDGAVLNRAVAVLLDGEVSAQTRQALQTQLANPRAIPAVLNQPAGNDASIGQRPIDDALIAGLVLGAPEFQRR